MFRPTMFAIAAAIACAALPRPVDAQREPDAAVASPGSDAGDAPQSADEGGSEGTRATDGATATEGASSADDTAMAEGAPPTGPDISADGTALTVGETGEPAATSDEAEPPRPGRFPPGGFRGWWKQQRTHPPRPVAASNWLLDSCVDCSVPFTGDRFRTRGPGAWFRRTAADWLAMPATVKTWGAPGWLTFGALTAATVVPMIPVGGGSPQRSLDVRLQDWINARKSERSDKAFLHVSTKQIVSGVIVWEALILGAGWASGNERLLEFGGLTVEAIADVQFYHILSKLLLGREGPKNGDGLGEVHGPTEFFFPAGTPSGHTATIYALLTVSAEFADSWALRVFSHLASLYFGMSLVYQNAHYVSDVIWGAAMGYYMGRWIMRYRSSRYRCDEPGERSLRDRITWMPVVSRHGVALGASLAL